MRGSDQTSQLIARLGLPARTNAQVRDLRENLTQRAEAIRADPAMAAADRSAQLGSLVQQARTQLTALLGPNGFEPYDDLKGEWIRGLRPEPPPR